MPLFTSLLIAIVMAIHVYIFLLETVWFRSRGRKVFGLNAQQAETMATAMSNQGCYNGFLATALALALVLPDPTLARAFALYGLGCVAVAGVWGAATVGRRILFVQTVPAVLGLAAVLLG